MSCYICQDFTPIMSCTKLSTTSVKKFLGGNKYSTISEREVDRKVYNVHVKVTFTTSFVGRML